MLIEVDFESGEPIYLQIVQQITLQVSNGILTKGTQIEGVRELARWLDVNPMTVSKAYKTLESEKVITYKKGKGYFVGAVKKSQQTKQVKQTLEQAFGKAALAAVHAGLTQKQAIDTFKKIYKEKSALQKEALQ